jgi:2-(1,2-epoxy-1,2-dihydrophenyl)acetyl-CoA isomerase
MLNRVVADAELMTEAVNFAVRLAQMPTAAIGRIKQMLAATWTNDLPTQLDAEHNSQIQSGKSIDFKEGVTAFFEKRKPIFRGD